MRLPAAAVPSSTIEVLVSEQRSGSKRLFPKAMFVDRMKKRSYIFGSLD
jgi:hypothetical protein